MKPEIPREEWPLYRNSITAKTYKSRGEINVRASLTVPNEAMSLREIMDRYARGLPLTKSNRTEIYHGEEEEMPDLRKMDLSEIHDLAQANSQRLKDYHEYQRIQQENQLLAKEKRLLALEEEVKRYREAQTTLTPNKPTI